MNVHKVKADAISRRFRLLCAEWESLSESMRFDEARLKLNPDILMEAVGSFYRQLQQFKTDHEIPWADRHKSGGFMMSWICRLKPIQILVSSITEEKTMPEESELLANELFAIQIGLSCLDSAPDLLGDYDFFDSLIKRLRERECPPEYLSSMLYLYERLRQKPQPEAPLAPKQTKDGRGKKRKRS